MPLDFQKELTPVLYGDSAVKILNHSPMPAGTLAFATHWHERMELLLIRSGSLLVTLGDRELEAPAGTLVICPPTRPHRGVAGKNGVHYLTIMFDIAAFFNASHASTKYLIPLFQRQTDFLPVTSHPEILRLAESIASEELEGDSFSPLLVVGKIYELIGLCYRHCPEKTKSAVEPGGAFTEVIAYAGEHFKEDLSSGELSRFFGYDEAYFCRRFKAITGLPPTLYIRILRLEYARKEIKKEKRTLSEIALECGFSDYSYFSRCFKRHFGLSPSEYAQKQRGS